MDFVRNWIINIATIVIIISAIELILPSNDIKKYAKFVMGLILMLAMMQPFLRLIDKNFDVGVYVSNAEKYLESSKLEVDYEKYRDENLENTLKVFRKNLEAKCMESLEEEFPDNKFDVELNVDYKGNIEEFNVNKITVWVEEKGIKKVKKVQKVSMKNVSTQNEEKTEDVYLTEIKSFISKKLDVSKSIVFVFSKE